MARIAAKATQRAGGTQKTKVTNTTTVLLKFEHADTSTSISRRTLRQIAKTLGLTERQTIHLALAKLRQELLPTYEPDDGPLSDETLEEIRRKVPQGKYRSVKSSLFPGA